MKGGRKGEVKGRRSEGKRERKSKVRKGGWREKGERLFTMC